MTTNEIIDDIIRREGGFVDHAADKGGATRFGITLATLAEWRNRAVTAEDVKALTETEAREIYREMYITKPGFLSIENETVRALVVDCAVNHGVSRAIKLLQHAVRTFPDGVFGPKTREGVNRMNAAAVYRRLIAQRAIFYGEIISKNPSQSVFAAGWMKRLAEFIEASP